MNLHMYFYSSISFSFSPPNSLVVFVTSTKLRLAVVFGVHYFIRIPSLCQHHARKLYGGTVHVLKLEKVELIDGDIHQKCSLRYARNSRIRKLASGYFCLKRKTRFLRNMCTMSTYLKHVEIKKF